ncbi:hypothetical protein J7K50_06805 [bacterium]|nr:hypothetical protein [bacterium]
MEYHFSAIVKRTASVAVILLFAAIITGCCNDSKPLHPSQDASAKASLSEGYGGDAPQDADLNPDKPQTGDLERGGSAALGSGGGGGGVLGSAVNTAGPIGDPQSLTDWTQTEIGPWGPVIYSYQVEIEPGHFVTVNKLISPDPFTSTYQLENGNILVTNLPLEEVLAPGYVEADPPVIVWQAPSGEIFEVVQGQILVTFETVATQQQIEQVIADHNLYVIFSWFEPPEEPGDGNSIAWFQFEYDRNEFPTMDDAYSYFSTHPLVYEVCPNAIDFYTQHYSPPNDPIYTGWNEYPPENTYHPPQCRYVNILDVDSNPYIPYGPGADPPTGGPMSDQIVAVMDDGVDHMYYDEEEEAWHLGHPDLGDW